MKAILMSGLQPIRLLAIGDSLSQTWCPVPFGRKRALGLLTVCSCSNSLVATKRRKGSTHAAEHVHQERATGGRQPSGGNGERSDPLVAQSRLIWRNSTEHRVIESPPTP
jgi:hypothetical protein